MNKADLIDEVAKVVETKKAAAAAVDCMIEVITKTLKKKGKVTLVGFGTFSVSKRAARKGRNPRTGKEIKIAAKKVARFKAGTALSSALNKAKPAPAKAARAKPGKNLKDSTK